MNSIRSTLLIRHALSVVASGFLGFLVVGILVLWRHELTLGYAVLLTNMVLPISTLLRRHD